MHVGAVVIAADKFKGSLTGRQVTAAIGETVAALGGEPRPVPVADGGDGTLDAVEELGFAPVDVVVPGPTGAPVSTRYAVRDGIAVVELADACGLLRLPGRRLEPLASSTRGLGEVARAALLDPAVEELVIGVGGSASTDGGAGMLVGLGAVLRNSRGETLSPMAGTLAEITTIDLRPVEGLLAGRPVTLASDVANPLLGPRGAVAVFGPQKGLRGEDVVEVEAGLAHWADVLAASCGRDLRDAPGAGSAGGVGFAALAALGARMRSGLEIVLELGGFARALGGASLVITGEGSLDEQSLMGKVVAGVCAAAGDVPTIAVCGRSTLTATQVEGLGLAAAYSLAQLEPDPAESIRRADELLRELTRRVLAQWPAMPERR